MKNLIISLVVLLLILSCSQSTNFRAGNDLEKAKLRGEISSLQQITYAANLKFGQLEKGKMQAREEREYNPSGNLLKVSKYDSSGELLQKTKYSYNDKQQLVSKKIFTEPELLKSIERLQYDEKGRLSERNLWDAEQNLQRKIVFVYTGKAEKSEKIQYDAEGKPEMRWSYDYNKQGQLIEKNHFAADSLLQTQWRYTYDKAGYLQETKTYILDGILQSRENYQYDKWGNPIKYEKTVSEYARLEQGLSSNMAQNIRYEYVYDAEHNWIESTEYQANEKPEQLRQRQINYY
ncbi:MAG: hypothetical protein R6U84_09995 [Candidatus Cloacimonadales bacterium]